jgi:tetratricopeptide (TPR) repeat protein
MRAPSLALALVACTACATIPTLRPVPPDGGGWRELRTQHFVLKTDVAADRARGLLAELEAVVDGLHKELFAGRNGELSLSVDVVAFESERDLEVYLPPNASAAVSFDPRWSGLTIVMAESFAERQRAVVAHELTHVLMAGSFARQPLWFQEGVACYAETIDWEGPNRNVALGRVPTRRQWSPLEPPAAAIRDLLVEDRSLDARQYSLAWGLVHYLIHRQPEPFAALQERFARGEEPMAAWRAIFPRWDPEVAGGAERLRDELWRYLSGGPHYYYWLPARKPEGIPASTERMLSAAEVHDIRLALPWRNRGKPIPPEARRAELDSAFASGSFVAAWVRAESSAERLAAAERATREHPSDARGWLLLASAVTEPARVEAALRTAVEVDPSNAAARSALARYLLGAGKALEALRHGTEAVRLAPWSPPALDTLAAVVHALGRCPEALLLERRAVENVREADRARHRAPYLERLARLEQSCGAREAGASR